MNTAELTRIAGEISLEETYTGSLCRFMSLHPELMALLEEKEESLSRKLFKGTGPYKRFLNRQFDKEFHPMINLYLALVLAARCKEEYRGDRIDPLVFRDTMSDINIWCRTHYAKNGSAGLGQMGWIRNHLMRRIYRLGRLQFETGRLNRLFVSSFSPRSECLHIHIPEGDRLDEAMCRESLDRAAPFFREHCGKEYKLACCHSWLLHSSLKEILPSGSNILKFAALFEQRKDDRYKKQALERVFGNASLPYKKLPETTTLQKKMKAYLLQGKSVGMGFGIIRL